MIATLATLATLLHINAAIAAGSARPRVGVDIDASTLGTFEAPMRERLSYEVSQVLAREGVDLVEAEGERDATLRIKVEFSGKSKVDYSYRVESTTTGSDSEVDATPRIGSCARCIREAVVKKVAVEIPAEIAEVRAALDTKTIATPEDTESSPAPAVATSPVTAIQNHKKRGVGKRGIGGAVLIGLGGSMLGVGVGLVARKSKLTQDIDGSPQEQIGVSTRRAGFYVLAGGVVALAVGIPLLVLDRRAASRRIAVTPVVSRLWTGVGLSGRF